MRALIAGLVVVSAVRVAAADRTERAERTDRVDRGRTGETATCYAALDELGVDYERVRRRSIDQAVKVDGPIGGVEYRAYRQGVPLILDCSLVYSLAIAGRFLTAHGIESVRYSSAYDRRNIRGTNRLSRHSFGLAIDVHTFLTTDAAYAVKQDYEQGLGDDVDCIGEPLTEAGRVMRAVECQLTASELFRIVLTPDYDADHYNHFHIEAVRWDERPAPSEQPALAPEPYAASDRERADVDRD